MKQVNRLQKINWRFGAWALCAALLLGVLGMPAYAAEADQVTATMSPAVDVVIDGVSQTFYSASGKEVHPIVYNNTVYLPVRSVGELMGKTMTWDESTLTVSLSGKRTAANVSGKPDVSAKSTKISVQLRPDFTVVVDGKVRSFLDSNGVKLAPMLYDGTIYLPLQSVGALLEKTTAWNAKTNTATLSKLRNSGTSVTDADSFGSASTVTPPAVTPPVATGTQAISKEQAKSIALKHAGLTENKVTFAHVYLEKDDRRWEYDIEFYTSDGTEYDYEIDAKSGAIVSFDSDAEYYSRPATSTPATSNSYIGAAKAKSLALARAGVTEGAIYAYKSELDRENGVMVYEIEFESVGYDYEVRVNATTGTIVKYERERD